MAMAIEAPDKYSPIYSLLSPAHKSPNALSHLQPVAARAAMAGRRRRRPNQARQAAAAAADTHISSLPDDIMRRIFLLLPSLATLVRAACTCRAWLRAVASSPDFRRRFRALHAAPPLLGFFFGAILSDSDDNICVVPTFAPVRLGDRDLAAALRGGDFFLTSLHERTSKDSLIIRDCRNGFVLLWTGEERTGEEKFFVFNPLMRHNEHVSCIVKDSPLKYTPGSAYEVTDVLQPRLVCSEEYPASFLIVLLCRRERDYCYADAGVCASVFSSETKKWSVLPWVDIPKNNDNDDNNIHPEDDDIPSDDDDDNIIYIDERGEMQANGSLFWLQSDGRHLVSLDTATMEFSFQELPLTLDLKFTFDAGEMKDGTTCIVYSDDQLRIGVLMRTRGDDGLETWVLDKVVPMDAELKRFPLNMWHTKPITKVFVVAVRDGYAYLSTTSCTGPFTDRRIPCWFMSLCLKTMRLERLFKRADDSMYQHAYLYIMPWPTCLAGNHGRFALEVAPGEDSAGHSA